MQVTEVIPIIADVTQSENNTGFIQKNSARLNLSSISPENKYTIGHLIFSYKYYRYNPLAELSIAK